jgi:hypothetical protein
MKARELGCGLVILALSAAPALAGPLPRYGLFVFSTLCWEEESGDAAGGRLILLRLPGSESARISYTLDGPLDEIPVDDLKIDDKSGHISFRYRSPYDPVTDRSDVDVTVQGFVDTQGFVQMGIDGKPHNLPRLLPPQKAIPVCR